MEDSLNYFQKPALKVDKIVYDDQEEMVLLKNSDREMSMSVSGNAKACVDLLENLRIPDSLAWQNIDAEGNEGVVQLVNQLQQYGWIEEASDTWQKQLHEDNSCLEKWFRDAVQWLKLIDDELDEAQKDRFNNNKKKMIMALKTGEWGNVGGQFSSVPERLLSIVSRHWRDNKPSVAKHLLMLLEGGDQSDVLSPCHSTLAVRNRIWSALQLLVISVNTSTEETAWVEDSIIAPENSGINFLTFAEVESEKRLAEYGGGELFEWIKGEGQRDKSAVLIHLHQSIISKFYPHVVLEFAGLDVRDDLRDLAIQYFQEEVGHEKHELDVLKDLGVGEDQLAQFSPLPFFSVYCDVLSCLTIENPLTFLLCISIAEGLPGSKKKIAGLLKDLGLQSSHLETHTEIDVELDHGQFTRRFFSKLPWVDSAQGTDAIRNYLFMLRYSQLCWPQMVSYGRIFGDQWVPKAFTLSPADLLQIKSW